ADSRAAWSDVTASPSTRRTGCSCTLAPVSSLIRSISMTSPTDTLCWRPPLRTIAYTPEPTLVEALTGMAPGSVPPMPNGRTTSGRWGRTDGQRCSPPRERVKPARGGSDPDPRPTLRATTLAAVHRHRFHGAEYVFHGCGCRACGPIRRQGATMRPTLSRRTLLGSAAAGLGAATLGLSGCAGVGGSAGDGDAVRFAWYGGTERQQAYLKLLELFEQANEGIATEPEYADYSPYQDRLATQLAAGDAP